VTKGASQLFERYWLNYSFNHVTYYIDDKLVNIMSFLLCTDSSIKGYLYKNNEVLIDNLKSESENKKLCVTRYKTIPRFEFSRTKDLVRIMFSRFSECRTSEIFKDSVFSSGYGILLLNLEFNKPSMFHMVKIRNKWGQHVWGFSK